MSHTATPWFAEDFGEDDGPNKFTIVAHEPEVLSPGQSGIWPDGVRKISIASTEDGDGDRLANAEFIVKAVNAFDGLDQHKRAISVELYRAFERLGADSELLGPIGSWGEGIYPDSWLLEQLRRYNKTAKSL